MDQRALHPSSPLKIAFLRGRAAVDGTISSPAWAREIRVVFDAFASRGVMSTDMKDTGVASPRSQVPGEEFLEETMHSLPLMASSSIVLLKPIRETSSSKRPQTYDSEWGSISQEIQLIDSRQFMH